MVRMMKVFPAGILINSIIHVAALFLCLLKVLRLLTSLSKYYSETTKKSNNPVRKNTGYS